MAGIVKMVASDSSISSTYFVADTHFGHHRIRGLCSRPFITTRQMDSVIFNELRRVMLRASSVFFLGDLGKWFLPSLLPYQPIRIKGNHDRIGYEAVCLITPSMDLLLIHNPFDQLTQEWEGWIVHGHSHNTRPYIDLDNKRVNVSVEAIEYKPVSLAQVIADINKAGGN